MNEIIEWAENGAECSIEQGTPDILQDASKAWPFIDTQDRKLENVFQPLRVKSVYIQKIAGKFNKSLQNTVDNLTANLRKQIKSLYDYREKKNKKQMNDTAVIKSTAQEIADNNKQLYESAIKVIEEAVKIKTEDIR